MPFFKKYKTKIIIITTIIIVCGFAAYFSSPSKKYTYKIPKIDLERQYEVAKVFDGDTFEIKLDKQTMTVRMLGIDTPETIDPRKPVQCFGKEASDMTKEILVGHSVNLQIDKTQSFTDKYGRLLAYVYRDDGLFINQYLLENGYAHEYTYAIPYTKQKEFKKIEKEAREQKKGFWGDLCKGITT